MTETPEQKARREIDAKLIASGWLVQDRDELDLAFRYSPRVGVGGKIDCRAPENLDDGLGAIGFSSAAAR